MRYKLEQIESMLEQSGHKKTGYAKIRTHKVAIWEDTTAPWNAPWLVYEVGQGYCEIWMPCTIADDSKLWDTMN